MLTQGSSITEFISCPICCKVFNESHQRPISLGCGHTVCKSCLYNRLSEKRCPIDQSELPSELEKLPANFALMQLIGATVPDMEKDTTKPVLDKPSCYEKACKCVEEMSVHLKPLAENASDDEGCVVASKNLATRTTSLIEVNDKGKCVLSRPLQKKLISLIHCQLVEEEGRSRSARIARAIGERIVSELLLLHQFSHQLSANLWAAVRTRGCQFLGPAMQEEVLKLILLALEDGSFLARKILVLFVVQRLECRYPQASKTAIGHVVQLLYRASCFKVLKRDEDSSLMQLKEEFCQYEALRREHDSQIVQIAIEAGLRISPDQWSSLLYGDSAHKSHMQSIIDKHQGPQSFAQSITELMLALQRNGDPLDFQKLRPQLEFLSNIDPSSDCPAPSWENLEAIMRSSCTVMKKFVEFLSNPDHKARMDSVPVQNARYKTSMCRDFVAKKTCPRGNTCTFAHSAEELERYRLRFRRSVKPKLKTEEQSLSSLSQSESNQLKQVQLMSRLKLDGESSDQAVSNSGRSSSIHLSSYGSQENCLKLDCNPSSPTSHENLQSFSPHDKDAMGQPLHAASSQSSADVDHQQAVFHQYNVNTGNPGQTHQYVNPPSFPMPAMTNVPNLSKGPPQPLPPQMPPQSYVNFVQPSTQATSLQGLKSGPALIPNTLGLTAHLNGAQHQDIAGAHSCYGHKSMLISPKETWVGPDGALNALNEGNQLIPHQSALPAVIVDASQPPLIPLPSGMPFVAAGYEDPMAASPVQYVSPSPSQCVVWMPTYDPTFVLQSTAPCNYGDVLYGSI